MSQSKLEELRSILNALQPELVAIHQNEVVHHEEVIVERYQLLFRDRERSCLIELYDREYYVRCMFQWDGADLFAVHRPEIKHLARMILRWVVKKTLPSTMQILYPNLVMGIAARYYEKGEGVKGEFIESWNEFEHRYEDDLIHFDMPYTKAYLQLMKILRAEGLHEHLRAGTSLSVFILSRSRRYGLGKNSSYISFSFSRNLELKIDYYFENPATSISNDDPDVMGSPYHPHRKSMRTELRYTKELKELIERLIQEEIK